MSVEQPISELLMNAGGWGTLGAGVASTVMLLRRRWSRDQTEMTKDRAESHLIITAMAERDEARAEARAAWASQQADGAAIARLTAQNEQQAREIQRLTQEFAAFKRMMARMHPETRDFLGTDFQPMPKEPTP
jgi:hypothetical protein